MKFDTIAPSTQIPDPKIPAGGRHLLTILNFNPQWEDSDKVRSDDTIPVKKKKKTSAPPSQILIMLVIWWNTD